MHNRDGLDVRSQDTHLSAYHFLLLYWLFASWCDDDHQRSEYVHLSKLRFRILMLSSILTVIDLFPTESATSTSTNNLIRCLLGAGGLAVIDPILNRLGAGYGFLSELC